MEAYVFRDWSGGRAPAFLGTIRTRPVRRGELFDFTFDRSVANDPALDAIVLDPAIVRVDGTQYPAAGHLTFGMLGDASPDRWGRTLIRRRFERDKRIGLVDGKARLHEADFLLGVHDAFRAGALRFKRSLDGAFLDDRDGNEAPPMVRLRKLEAASRALERDPDGVDPQTDAWLRMLFAPGASLGGARPKATVVDPEGHLWIAKFPSINDTVDVGGWELVAQRLAERCGIDVPVSTARVFSGKYRTFMVKRFDRSVNGRIHFASAMTLTGHLDGDDADTGASYIEIADAIIRFGSAPKRDLSELWRRIAFNVLVSNADDHLRNHGFLLDGRSGWRLSPAFDVNPVPNAIGLSLNIDESDNTRDLDLVRSVAPTFRVAAAEARETIERFRNVVATWARVADAVGVAKADRDVMAEAFSPLP